MRSTTPVSEAGGELEAEAATGAVEVKRDLAAKQTGVVWERRF